MRIKVEDTQPEFVHPSTGQIENVGGYVLKTSAILGDDG
jgi:hypothetical protein